VFVPSKAFQPGLMALSRPGACLRALHLPGFSLGLATAFLADILSGLKRENIAYFSATLVTKKKLFYNMLYSQILKKLLNRSVKKRTVDYQFFNSFTLFVFNRACLSQLF
jgi:hypothetical protein